MVEKLNTRLNSWKEIADYLGYDVRTVMRWEKERGLPVHRLPGGGRHVVFAYTDQIDTWLNGRPAGADAIAVPAGPRFFSLTKPWVVGGIAALVVLLIAGSFFFLNSLRVTPIARVTVAGTKVQAWDERGRLAWSYDLPLRVAPMHPSELERRVVFADLNGDGTKEVLAAPPFLEATGDAPASGTLYCFSQRGELMWRYQPDATLSFAGYRYSGAWGIADLLVVPGTPADSLFVAVHHIPWWPSFVVRLDAHGRAGRLFVNSGQLIRLNYLRAGQRPYLLVAGANNEYEKSGILAVVDAEGEPATSPQSPGSAFRCDGCPVNPPLRYVFFPRSELHRLLSNESSSVSSVTVSPNNTFEVRTVETTEWYGPAGLYVFSSDFNLVSASRTDSYWEMHRKLEQEGKIKHPADQCPERTQPLSIRVWTPETGWASVQPREWPPPTGHPAAATSKKAG